MGATPTAKAWIGGLVDSAQVLDDKSNSLDFVLVAPDVFKQAVSIVDGSDRSQIVAGNPSNNLGTGSVPGLSVTVAGVPFVVEHGLPAGSAYAADRNAWTTMESPGAPVRLQDENVVNLSKDFSVYGYAAFANIHPDAIVKLTF